MKVLILYRERSEHRRAVDTFVHDFERQHRGIQLQLADLDTREGANLAQTYDIVAYPGILALADDGSVLQVWQGPSLPLMSDVASYTYA